MNTQAQPLLIELTDATASGREITVSVAGFDIRGQVTLHGAHFHLAGRDGTVTAERIIVREVTMMGHGLRVGGQELEASKATVSWGAAGLRIEAASVSIRALQVIGDHEPVDGTFVFEGVALSELAVDGGEVHVRQVRVAATQVAVALPSRDVGAAPSSDAAPAASTLLDRLRGVLDRLTGHVNVDLGLDLTVPVIGRRRATHHFRIPIDAGSINYRRLEDNLSALEDSLLDFSVRDEGLVLEVGIPLLPTRGKGKPIVVWALDGADLELARQQRVRISVLARPNLTGKSDDVDDGDEKPSAVALREADVRGLDIRLAVARGEDSPIRMVGSLVLAGEMTYKADESPEGVLRGQAENVELGAVAAGPFSIRGLRLDAASELVIGLRGATPVQARVVAQNLQLDRVHVAPNQVDDLGAEDQVTGSNGSGSGHLHMPHAPHASRRV